MFLSHLVKALHRKLLSLKEDEDSFTLDADEIYENMPETFQILTRRDDVHFWHAELLKMTFKICNNYYCVRGVQALSIIYKAEADIQIIVIGSNKCDFDVRIQRAVFNGCLVEILDPKIRKQFEKVIDNLTQIFTMAAPNAPSEEEAPECQVVSVPNFRQQHVFVAKAIESDDMPNPMSEQA